MLSKGLRCMMAVIVIAGLAFTLPCSDAFAQPRGGGGRHGDIGHGRSNGARHYYRDGNWYRHGLMGFDIAVSALAIGALIDSLPPRHTTVVVSGTPYYYYNDYYYEPYQRGGYVVVPPPTLVQPVQVVSTMPATIVTTATVQDVSTVNIPNSHGGYTAVTLKRAGNGFVGPQGEYYSENPTVEQLKVLYGK